MYDFREIRKIVATRYTLLTELVLFNANDVIHIRIQIYLSAFIINMFIYVLMNW